MKAARITDLKRELKNRTKEDLENICLELAKFKIESKELLTYLVFEKSDEQAYIRSVNEYTTTAFSEINQNNYYYTKKGVRRILRQLKRYIRYSKKKETEAEILMHFCKEMQQLQPPYHRNRVLTNIYNKQLEMAERAISKLHPDLQFDYGEQIEKLK